MTAADGANRQTAEEAKSPEELRGEIEETRAELGDTVQALAEKTDVKAQAKQRAAAAKATALQKKQELTAKVKASAPDSASAGAQQMTTKAKENPVPLTAGAAFFFGYLIGRRRAR